MSTSSNTTGYQTYPSTTLPTTSTYLPILDDLLSPDFRPVTYPPVITPLQTPTANPASGSNQAGVVGGGCGAPTGSNKRSVVSGDEAALKIQKWWKSSRGASCDGDGRVEEGVRHSIRHRRADEHIRHLESELSRVKSTLSAERKLRSLQYEAIRSLWSQVQKLSINNNPTAAGSPGIMSQSCPNVLPLTTVPPPPSSSSGNQPSCTCSAEIRELKVKIEREVGELKGLVGLLLGSREADEVAEKEPDADGKGAAEVVPNESVAEEEACSMKRPDTLDLNNGNNKPAHHHHNATGEELQGYADDMAKYVVERGLSDNNSNLGNADEKWKE